MPFRFDPKLRGGFSRPALLCRGRHRGQASGPRQQPAVVDEPVHALPDPVTRFGIEAGERPVWPQAPGDLLPGPAIGMAAIYQLRQRWIEVAIGTTWRGHGSMRLAGTPWPRVEAHPPHQCGQRLVMLVGGVLLPLESAIRSPIQGIVRESRQRIVDREAQALRKPGEERLGRG
jgi:hypothetical protein